MLVSQDFPLVKPRWLSQITSLSSMSLSRASGRIHDLTRHRGEAERSVVPRVLLSKWAHFFPFSSHQGHHLTTTTFQMRCRVARQRNQPIPSGLWAASHQVPQTSVDSGSSGGHEPGLPLQWEWLHSPVPQLVVHLLRLMNEECVCCTDE